MRVLALPTILAASTLLALARAQAPPAAPAHGTTYTVFETGLTTTDLSGLSWQRAMSGTQSTNPSCETLGGQLAAPSSLYWNGVLADQIGTYQPTGVWIGIFFDVSPPPPSPSRGGRSRI